MKIILGAWFEIIYKCRIRIFLFLLFFNLTGALCLRAQIITTIAGLGPTGPVGSFSGDGGPATAAGINRPAGMAVDSAGNIYFVDQGNRRVRMINPSGIINTIAGNGYYVDTGDGGQATNAGLNTPTGVAVDNLGTVYITVGSNRVRTVNTAGIINTFAGNGTLGYSGDGGPATAAQLYSPIYLAVNRAGDVFIAESGNNCIRKVSAAGIISTFAGNGTLGFSGDGGPATAAQLNNPHGIALDVAGNLFISDMINYRIRKVDTNAIITTFAGTGIMGYSGDGGPATAAGFWQIDDISVDDTGNVYLNDYADHRIRKVDTFGIITTIAGTGTGGFSGDGGPATAAQIFSPRGSATLRNDNFVFSDNWNNRIRMIGLVNHSPGFAGGHVQHITACSEFTVIDTLLSVVDSDALQTETWSLIYGPFHGSATASYSAISSGGLLTTTGLTYSPSPGYTGTDTFRVRVTDGFASDTTTIYVTILNFPTVTPIIGKDTVCTGDSIILTDTTAGGAWSVSNTNAVIAGGIVTGITAGAAIVSYTIVNGCGSTTAMHPTIITDCALRLPTILSKNKELEVLISPNPNSGSFNIQILSSNEEHAKVIITDIIGRPVKELSSLTNVGMTLQLCLPGMYFVQVYTEASHWFGKVLVQ